MRTRNNTASNSEVKSLANSTDASNEELFKKCVAKHGFAFVKCKAAGYKSYDIELELLPLARS